MPERRETRGRGAKIRLLKLSYKLYSKTIFWFKAIKTMYNMHNKTYIEAIIMPIYAHDME